MSNRYKNYVLSIKPEAKHCMEYGVYDKHIIHLPKQRPNYCIGQGETKRRAWKDASYNTILSKPEKIIEIG